MTISYPERRRPNNALWSAAAAPLECGGIEQTFRLSDNLRSPDGALAATSTLRRRGWRILAQPDHVPGSIWFFAIDFNRLAQAVRLADAGPPETK